MDAKATLILISLISTCLAISVKCEGEGAVSRSGGLLRQPDGEQTISGSMITVVLCFIRTCEHNSFKSCYCCGMLPNIPCYPDKKQCWSVCPHQRQSLPAALPAWETSSSGLQQDPKGVVYHGLISQLQTCDIC
ncbi:hypothetical protein EJB05_24794 [Eragrostis curvula]|uniref:Embryo surrounding factor 1 brassicaceae domain-containing protein n=1 Tax=Eragrostis curvula TaxID=38414 RepID=A0A5J9SJU0_9POAL|nr:hypothetical protein EJB05_55406 [Eragrostis curvula]TVU33015.1 hypothetical protein EJB05_24794 [Eragrostis curvula]